MANAARAGVVPTVAGTALLLCACSSTKPVGPDYVVRLEAAQGRARIMSGSASAMDPPGKPQEQGDQWDLERNLGLTGSPGQHGAVEVRLSPDDEVRLSFDRFHDFHGSSISRRTQTFDGTRYPAGTNLDSNFDWNRTAASWAHRVAEWRGGTPVDLFARVGMERDQYRTTIHAFPPPPRDRFAWSAAPTAGLEARVGLTRDLMLVAGANAGYLNYGDKEFSLGNAKVELRWNVFGPLELLASYEVSSQHIDVLRDTGEQSDVRSNVGIWLVGVALHF